MKGYKITRTQLTHALMPKQQKINSVLQLLSFTFNKPQKGRTVLLVQFFFSFFRLRVDVFSSLCVQLLFPGNTTTCCLLCTYNDPLCVVSAPVPGRFDTTDDEIATAISTRNNTPLRKSRLVPRKRFLVCTICHAVSTDIFRRYESNRKTTTFFLFGIWILYHYIRIPQKNTTYTHTHTHTNVRNGDVLFFFLHVLPQNIKRSVVNGPKITVVYYSSRDYVNNYVQFIIFGSEYMLLTCFLPSDCIPSMFARRTVQARLNDGLGVIQKELQ